MLLASKGLIMYNCSMPINGNTPRQRGAFTAVTRSKLVTTDSHYMPPDQNGQEDSSQSSRIVSRYISNKPLYCASCEEAFIDILNDVALVWRKIPDKTSETLTAFNLTHKTRACISNVFSPAITPHWSSLSDFFKDGEFTFEYFSDPEDGAEVNRQSLARIAILLNPAKIETRVVFNRSRGFVYLIQSPTGAYKIGRTSNPENRMKMFRIKLPFEIEIVCLISTEDMYHLEKELHRKFVDKRVNGEWFNLTPEDVEYIKGLAK